MLLSLLTLNSALAAEAPEAAHLREALISPPPEVVEQLSKAVMENLANAYREAGRRCGGTVHLPSEGVPEFVSAQETMGYPYTNHFASMPVLTVTPSEDYYVQVPFKSLQCAQMVVANVFEREAVLADSTGQWRADCLTGFFPSQPEHHGGSGALCELISQEGLQAIDDYNRAIAPQKAALYALEAAAKAEIEKKENERYRIMREQQAAEAKRREELERFLREQKSGQ